MKINHNHIGTSIVYIQNKINKKMNNLFKNIYRRYGLLITTKQSSIRFNLDDFFRIKDNIMYSIACRARKLYTSVAGSVPHFLINLNF